MPFLYWGSPATPADVAGYRSFLGLWLGGRGAAVPATGVAGFTGFFAFWMGGLGSDPGGTPPTPAVSEYIVTYRRRRR